MAYYTATCPPTPLNTPNVPAALLGHPPHQPFSLDMNALNRYVDGCFDIENLLAAFTKLMNRALEVAAEKERLKLFEAELERSLIEQRSISRKLWTKAK